MNPIYVKPAYGRSYHNVQDARKDWDSGEDFRIENGPYCSVRDFNRLLDIVVLIQPFLVEKDHIYLQYGIGI